ncbi:PadR family transcriptional regulator [Effusibacillus lacus]|uniref:PadR family transcriptional regulator n=1 Tax=Effusibacillus lacus TaxID=1348429 RepID=A0A292YKI3_9BACL|nr:PadR family transcriptional regulator [Effusibacillus lacus]TCS70782.1 PadR family transcriptional regulator [Effusibacillus lacus]GAX89421.1 PadR family transcriptional regulator [Effusibacillus lacus]
MELRLLILGLLSEHDLHPYEVLQILKTRQVHDYIKVNYGTLYYAFDQMEKNGWIAVKEVIQEEKRPEKRVYRITETGREEFRKLLHKAFRSEAKIFHPLYPALMNGHLANTEEVAAAMEWRLQIARKNVEFLRELYRCKSCGHPYGVVMLIKNALMHSETELAWLEEFLEGVKAGRLS